MSTDASHCSVAVLQGEMARDQALLVAALRGGRMEVETREVPEGRHNEAFWCGEFPRAFGWLVRPAP